MKYGWEVGKINVFVVVFLTDYAEELRFYLIHMTEVRERLVCVYVCWKETEGKSESNVNRILCQKGN